MQVNRTDADAQTDPVARLEPPRLATAPVAIAGMHRSGTSMVAKLLHEAGLHLGDASNLMPPAAQNPEGFFEHLEFVRLNDELLNAAGAGWDCPPPAEVDWSGAAFEPFRQRARTLAQPLSAYPHWGWKDPRTSLLLPFWRSALGPVRAIVVVRNPLEVVTSLHRRNGFSAALALTLWQTYAERILADTAAHARLVTHFDAYFLDPGREIGRVLGWIGLDADAENPALQDAAVPSLRHHRKTLADLVEEGFPDIVIATYRQLLREADWWEGETEPLGISEPAVSTGSPAVIARGIGSVDLLRVELETLRRNNDDFAAALANREARIADLESALERHEAARAEADSRVADRDGRIMERNAVLARAQHTINALQQQAAASFAELDRLREQLGEHSARLAEQERSLEIAAIHEADMRAMLNGMHAIQNGRDAELMATLGAVLSRHAPGSPAAIYHRRLLGSVREFVDRHVPAGARTLVATYGDAAMLELGDRPTAAFPRSPTGAMADYTVIDEREAVAQLEALRGDGAEFLVVPSPALPWLASHPELERHLEERAAPIARERGIATIYALGRVRGALPA